MDKRGKGCKLRYFAGRPVRMAPKKIDDRIIVVVVVVVVVYFILSRLLYIGFSANLGLLCVPHPGMRPLVQRPFRRTAE